VSRWSVHSYRRPYLRVDDVQIQAPDEVVLYHADQTFGLAPSAATHVGLAELTQLIESMRDPDSPVWAELKHENPWQSLVERLDLCGLLAEADHDVPAAQQAEETALRAMVDHAASWLNTAIGGIPSARHGVAPNSGPNSAALAKLRRLATTTLTLADGLLLDIAVERDPDLIDGFGQGAGTSAPAPPSKDLSGFVLDRLLRQWRRTAPHSVAAICLVLRAVPGLVPYATPKPAQLAGELLHQLSAGPYEPAEVATHLTCFTSLLVRPAERILDGLAANRAGLCSGTNLALDAELLSVRALRLLGRSRYHETLASGRLPPRLAAGIYVEQYQITRRFVEIIIPMLAKRLRTPLRDRMFGYYAEEIGHEIFELETCIALGLDQNAVQAATPLPAWTAYLDVFAYVAETDPIGLLVSVMVTEGLPGTRTPVNDLLVAAGAFDGTAAAEVMRRHEEVNVELDHTTLARRLLATVPAVPPSAQHRALDHMLVLLELNFRAWEDLHWYYTLPDLPALHGPLGVPPEKIRSAVPPAAGPPADPAHNQSLNVG
jgi:hypothetical protein